MLRPALLCAMLALAARAGQGQALGSRFSLTAQYGFLWTHTDVVRQLRCHPFALLASVAPARWAAAPGLGQFRRGRFGLTAGWLRFGRGDLGSACPVMLFFENATRPEGHASALAYRISAGAAALSHTYQIEDNPTNLAYASAIACALQLRLGYERQIGRAFAQAGFSLTHFSNGAYRLPNAGTNIPALYLTLGFDGSPSHYQRPVPDTTPLPHHHYAEVTLATGWKAIDTYPAPTYWNGLARLAYRYAYGPKGDFAAGLDLIHNRGLAERAARLGRPSAGLNRIGLTLGHEWYLCRDVAIGTHLGLYLRDALPVDKPLYQRYGVRFAGRRRLSPAVWLRAHLGQADCIEYALTYSFLRRS